MAIRSEQPKAGMIDQVVSIGRKRLSGARAKAFEGFVHDFYSHVPSGDMIEETPEYLYGAALSCWRLASERKPKQANVRVFNPTAKSDGWSSPHTIVEIVNDDMPFLVNSVRAEINRRNLTVHLVIHPLFKIKRDESGKLSQLFGLHDGKPAPEGVAVESIMHVRISEQTSPAALKEIDKAMREILVDVRAAVEDYQPIRQTVNEVIGELEESPPPLPQREIEEAKELLAWMRDDRFTFLGYRQYLFEGKGKNTVLTVNETSGQGILRQSAYKVFDGLRDFKTLADEVRAFLQAPQLLLITKTNRRSSVHRNVHMDAVFVKQFDADGDVAAQRLFIGLFTSDAYSMNASSIPVLRPKVERVIARSGLPSGSHDARALGHILEQHPRDELFQTSEDKLLQIATGILHLQERQKTALFVRRDPFGRFISCLVYVGRDRLNTQLRETFQSILEEETGGKCTASYAHLGEETLARLHYIIKTERDKTYSFSIDAVERKLVEAGRSWADRMKESLIQTYGEERGLALQNRYRSAFRASYRENYSTANAVGDIDEIENILAGAAMSIKMYRHPEAAHNRINIKLIVPRAPIPLSDVLPILEDMGLRGLGERASKIKPEEPHGRMFMHDFSCETTDRTPIDLPSVRENLEEAFQRIWNGEMEGDGFNALIVQAGLSWRQIVVLRTYAKYLKQVRIPFSQDYISETMAKYPQIARHLVDMFDARFDVSAEPVAAAQKARCVRDKILNALDEVNNLDEDRIIRRYVNAIECTLRTNFHQPAAGGGPKSYISLKLDSGNIEDLPKPRPWREIFVYSPRVEAVHLRGGSVARGGLRWSDRREDFRTEILGLAKAQMVKNAVIVPVGSKGGFVVKRPPTASGREAHLEEGIACYKTFMGAMLDITDNLIEGRIVPPKNVLRHDGDDPYLVVAADKGTATFSDIANGVSEEYGHWLGDAYASGGSAGYDHKKMGITAKGAWESVKRHFREMGKNIQTTPFTAVGVGDMSGDVFGNGMLLSERIKLVAAFNHLHIFVDPDPDPAKSFKERKRLFELPRSAWTDYDPEPISKGGGIFDRSAKSIDVSPEMKALFEIQSDSVTPSELLRAILRAEVELLWFGGIGTYVKASSESHADAGDRANDPLRLDGHEVRAAVIGEGANLGITQLGRVEFSRKGCGGRGGRANTDFIDNSAGVDCSDHEVNIKILLAAVEQSGDMTRKQRDKLLEQMTDEVAQLVLQDNYRQSLAITMMQERASALLDEHARFIRRLERAGRLDRAVEFLPDEEQIADRRNARLGFTRPELSVLLSYAKIVIYDEILASDLPDDPLLVADLMRYFPVPLQNKYKGRIETHRLRREIIATYVTNSMVNRVGCTFVAEMEDRTGASPADVARAYAVVRDCFDLRTLWMEIDTLDNKAPAQTQHAMLREVQRLVERAVTWFLRNCAHPIDISAKVSEMKPGIAAIAGKIESVISPDNADIVRTRLERFVDMGVPDALAHRVAALTQLSPSMEIVQVAKRVKMPAEQAAQIYTRIGDEFSFDWLRMHALKQPIENHWQEMAIRAVVEDLVASQSEMCGQVLSNRKGTIENWSKLRDAKVEHARIVLEDMRMSGEIDLAMLIVANGELKNMIAD